jgi:hypothetical protein
MIEIEQRIRHAATTADLRAAASELWKKHAPSLFDPHDERHGLRVSDAGACVRALWNEVHGVTEKAFPADVQLFNLDDGTMGGAWFACLLAASLEADEYWVDLEPEVEHDGTPGHIDLYFAWLCVDGVPSVTPGYEPGVVEFKRTNWSGTLDHPEKSKRYHILQAAKYAAAKGVEDFAVVTVGPAARGAKMRADWFKTGDWQHAVIGEWMRLSAALGDNEPVGDPDAPFRCKGCPVIKCDRNPAFVDTTLLAKLEESYAQRNAG